eukprot:SAG31_NODE_4719_length_3010_cov_1.948128_3_plen_53_part_00
MCKTLHVDAMTPLENKLTCGVCGATQIQDEIDKCNKTVDEILRAKEQDIMHT